MEKKAELLEKAKETASSPGVYQMKDIGGTILYIGKAKSLKSRLSSYFQSARSESPRIEMLIEQIEDFEVILTETEAEALILECTLIKKHKPKFNVRLKDDKTYPYLRVRMEVEAPRLEYTRKVKKDGSRYFGPFASAYSARSVMHLLNETFKLRDCSDNTYRHRSRPCILFQMEKCSAPCVGEVSSETYKESVEEAVGVLEGKADDLIASLERGMKDASEKQEYEDAAHYRDQIQNLKLVTETQGVFEAGSESHRDVLGVARSEGQAHGTVLQIRGGKMIAIKHFQLFNVDPAVKESELLFDFLAQYYVMLSKEQEKAPEGARVPMASEVLVPEAPNESELLERIIGATLRIPETDEENQLVGVAHSNAAHSLEMKRRRGEGHGVEALEEIQRKLHLTRIPHRIECYDISNIQGDDAVASRVTFIDGAPDKDLYRRYKIRTVEGANDFAMMREVLDRRFTRDESLPDLVVVDGGKGQLGQAVKILEELNVQGVECVGLAKARTERNFKAKEVSSTEERIFIPNRKNPVGLRPDTAAYRLLVHIRDEAHRFAVSYHRKVRSKRTLQ